MADPKGALHFAKRSGKRIVIAVVGSAVVVIGILLSFPLVPGPGLLLILAGLAILATEFSWARRLLNRVRRAARQTADRVRRRKPAAKDELAGRLGGGEPVMAQEIDRDRLTRTTRRRSPDEPRRR